MVRTRRRVVVEPVLRWRGSKRGGLCLGFQGPGSCLDLLWGLGRALAFSGPLLPVLTAPGAATEPFPQRAQRWHSLATYNLLESHTSTSGSGAGPRGYGAPVPPREKLVPVPLTSPW